MEGIFQKKYIDKYGIEFLLSNSKILNENILNENIDYIECLKYIFNSKKINEIVSKYNLNISTLIEQKYNQNQLRRIEKLYNRYKKNETINDFLDKYPDFIIMLGNDDIYETLDSIIAYTCQSNVVTNLEFLYPLLKDDKFILFINTCIPFFSKQYSNKFINFYMTNKNILNQINLKDKKIIEKIKIWINSNVDIYSIYDLDNIKEIRKEKLINRIRDNYDEKEIIIIKTEIIRSLYNIQLYEFTTKLENIYNVIRNYPISKNISEKVDAIYSIIDLNTKEEFISYVLEHENDIYNLEEIESLCKSICFKSIQDNLHITKGQEIISLEGEPFTVLAHRIASLNDNSLGIYLKLLFDISQWDKNYDQHSIVSTSLINEYNFSLVQGKGTILIFDTFEPERILDMGIKDIYSTPNFYKYDLKNDKTKLLMFDEFIRQVNFGYNEVVLKRYLDGKNIRPNGIFCLDTIKSKDFKAANYFKVPIYQIKTNCYINLMTDHLNCLLSKNDIDSYTIYLKQFL